MARIRRFFEGRGYWEVETPLLSADVCVDAHLDPFVTRVESLEGPPEVSSSPKSPVLYLQTSPEFAMKRLLAAGSGSIYQIARAFRQGEAGPLHNPEFTIIEWYKVDASYHELMEEVAELVRELIPTPPIERLSYQEAFERLAGFDPFAQSTASLAERCRELELTEPPADRDDLLNFLLATLVEPALGAVAPTFVYDFPASQAALACTRPGPPAVAERFELYFRGIELCNGFQELTDAAELRQRNQVQNAKRLARGKPALPIESRLLEAMELGLPRSTGVALGFDRLVMLAVGATTLAEVIAFPIDRA